MCSDGLSRMVSDSAILHTCLALRSESGEVICKELIDTALNSGGRDNVSVIVVKIMRLGREYQPTDEESRLESEAQVRNLMDLSDTPPTEVISASELFRK